MSNMNRIYILLFAFVAAANAATVSKPLLKGVAFEYSPYVKYNGTTKAWSGFCVELLDKIAQIAGFDYELSREYTHGMLTPNGTMGGMVGEVAYGRADFAICDITVTKDRQQFVHFTEPFISASPLSALVHRQHLASNQTALEDLVRSSSPPQFLVLNNGRIFTALQNSNSSLGKLFYEQIMANSTTSLIQTSYREGVQRAGKGQGEAFLVETIYGKPYVQEKCELTLVKDTSGLDDRAYAIPLAKDSPYLAPFNSAIQQLKADGTIDAMLQKIWARNCGTQ